MATAREHMQADMAFLFAQEGEEVRDVVIDGSAYRAIVQELDVLPGEFNGSIVERRKLFLQADAFSAIVGQERQIDGLLWMVVSTSIPGELLTTIIVERYTA